MTKSVRTTIVGITLSLIILSTMIFSVTNIVYAKAYSDSSVFTISSDYDKAKETTSPFSVSIGYKFSFGSTLVADKVTTTVVSGKATSCKVVTKWTSKTGTTLSANDSGAHSASAIRKGLVGIGTKGTYHQVKASNSSGSYTFIATGSR